MSGSGSVSVCGGGGWLERRVRTYSLDNLPVCSMIICFIR